MGPSPDPLHLTPQHWGPMKVPSTQPNPMTNTLPTETETALVEMLTECTGTHFLDSGGAYGRHWQRAEGMTLEDFRARPEARCEFSTWTPRSIDGTSKGPTRVDVSVTLDAFHWLSQRLDYDAERTEAFREWCAENDHSPNLDGQNEYRDELCDRGMRGIYEDEDPFIVNTYNGEDFLSQTLQYLYWNDPENRSAYVLLAIHGGADVRGGYTDCRVFEIGGPMGCIDGTEIFDNARCGFYVDDETVPRRTEDATPPLPSMAHPVLTYEDRQEMARGARWYADGGLSGIRAEPNCEHPTEGGYRWLPDLDDRLPCERFEDDGTGTFRNEEGETLDDRRGRGVLCVLEDGRAYCPVTGGQIHVSPF